MFQHMHADQAGSYSNALPLFLPLPKMSSRYWFRGAARELVEDRCSYPQGSKDGDVQITPLNHMTWQEPMQHGHFHHTLAPPNRPRPPCSPSAQEQRAQVRVIMNDVLFKIPEASTKADSPGPIAVGQACGQCQMRHFALGCSHSLCGVCCVPPCSWHLRQILGPR